MCLSPDEMTTEQLNREIAWYDSMAAKSTGGYYAGKAAMLRELIAQREADGTTDIVPEVTPRHLNSTTV